MWAEHCLDAVCQGCGRSSGLVDDLNNRLVDVELVRGVRGAQPCSIPGEETIVITEENGELTRAQGQATLEIRPQAEIHIISQIGDPVVVELVEPRANVPIWALVVDDGQSPVPGLPEHAHHRLLEKIYRAVIWDEEVYV
jgi:hypothetical protein